jgi:hypothetical protein
MSIIDLKNFVGGGMDTDSAPELIAKNDYVEGFNIRNTGNKSGEEGYVIAVESNSAIPLTLQTGINKCIGSAQFENVRKIYKFIYNSQNRHLITEIDYDTDTETIIFTNLVDSDSVDVLNLDSSYYITDIKLLNDLLIFRNSLNEPCLINIARLKSGGYGTVTKDDFLLIKKPPSVTPIASYSNDQFFYSNLLQGKLFQFRHQFIYEDQESSVWGPISNRPVPEEEANPNVGFVTTSNNCLIITVDIGDNRVTEINVASRQGNLDWAYINDVKRSEILAIPNSVIDINNQIYEAYNPATNTYSFVFHNNGLYSPVDVLETDLLQDHIPKQSESLEVINGRGDVNSNSSILTLGNNTEGYARPNTGVDINVTPYNPNISIIPPPATNYLKVVAQPAVRISGTSRRNCLYLFSGAPALNDAVEIYVINLNGTIVAFTYELLVTITDVGAGLLETVKRYAADIAATNTVRDVSVNLSTGGVVELRFTTKNEDDNPGGMRLTSGPKPPLVTVAAASSGAIRSIHSLKTNSSYQLALAYYDRYGRSFPIQTNTRLSTEESGFVARTDPYPKYNGQLPSIDWSLSGPAPEFAETYQWLISPNTTHLNTVYVAGSVDNPITTATPTINVNIKSFNKYQENNPNSTVFYDFSKGDRVLFCYSLSDDTNTKNFFDGVSAPIIDVEVVDYVIDIDTEDPELSTYTLVIRTPSSAGVDAINEVIEKNLLLEIYTPLNSTAQLDNTIFYEIGPRYPITNGEHTVTSGNIRNGDTYFKTRTYNLPSDLETSYTFLVEDFNFSDFYDSKFTEYGRARSYFDTPENKKFMADIRYSYELVADSRINLLNRFYPENKVSFDSRYGGIKKLFQRDNTLVCIQETKVGYIPINVSIIEDQVAQENIATSTRLLNKIRYSESGNMGIGNAVESFTEYSGTMYFVDPNRSEPVQISYNGIRPISAKMSKYFKNTLKNASDNNVKIIGYYNIYNKEYIVTTESTAGFINQLAFNDTNWEFNEPYTVNNSTLAIVGSPSNGTLSAITATGSVDYTGDIGTTGSDTFSFSFTPTGGGASVTKNVCINVSQGNIDLFNFILGFVVNQPLSSDSDPSNIIGNLGNTAPVAISISAGGQYRINGGAWTSSSGYYYPGEQVEVRVFTSASLDTETTTTLTIGNRSAVFSATTETGVPPEPPTPIPTQYYVYGFDENSDRFAACPLNNLNEAPQSVYAGTDNPFAVTQFYNNIELTIPWPNLPSDSCAVSFSTFTNQSVRYAAFGTTTGAIGGVIACNP